MRLFITLSILALIIAGMAGAGVKGYKYIQEKNKPTFRFVEVDSGDIEEVVNATGEIKPILTLQIGSFVSGPIVKIEVDFNDRVEKDDLLAQIDKRIFLSNVKRDEASLTTREAEVKRMQAMLNQAQRDEKRAKLIREDNKDYVSGAEMDQVIANRASFEAQLEVAEAGVKQAMATLENSTANLEYCDIRATEAGIVIDRKIEPGQTLAAQFQAPELFSIAVDLDKEVYVYASVDEAEIGSIDKAQKEGRQVTFTVDAHRDDLFEGTIHQIRLSATMTQNVVTYPVVVRAPNTPDMKLRPGMTASLSFQTDARTGITRIPNSALRFFPTNAKWVHVDDRKLLDGSNWDEPEDDNEEEAVSSAKQTHASQEKRRKRHVWVKEGEFLRAVEVELGISDSKFTELVKGDLKVEQKLVTGLKRGKK
jgi:HlyD family secretion protein